MHANNPMCHVSMYNQILSSAAGPCGKLAKLAEMRSENTANNDALSSNAGHGDAEGMTQPKSDARCTATEDFFQSSSNFKSALAALTTTETRALVAARPRFRDRTTHASSVTTSHHRRYTHIAPYATHTPPRAIHKATIPDGRRRARRYPTPVSRAIAAPRMRAVDAPADARRRHLTRESHARNPDAIISPITPRDRRLASSSSRANERAIATAIAIRAVL